MKPRYAFIQERSVSGEEIAAECYRMADAMLKQRAL